MLYIDEAFSGFQECQSIIVSKISTAGKKGGWKSPHEKLLKFHSFWSSLDPDEAVHAVHNSFYRGHDDVRSGSACSNYFSVFGKFYPYFYKGIGSASYRVYVIFFKNDVFCTGTHSHSDSVDYSIYRPVTYSGLYDYFVFYIELYGSSWSHTVSRYYGCLLYTSPSP